MTLVLNGPLPRWLAACGDRELRARLGSGPVARGADYARAGAVLTLTMHEQDGRLDAVVRGNGRTYRTVVTAPAVPGPSTEWRGRCTCPRQIDCKHVAAVLITSRTCLSDSEPLPVASPWESELSALVRRADAEPALAPLGLQLEVFAAAANRFDAAPTPRLRLRPVTRGKAGGWIRTGAAWRDIENRYSRLTIRADHRDVMLAILATSRARQSSYSSYSSYSGYGSYGEVHLDDLGPAGWRLLSDAQQAGIALVSTTPARRQVHLAAAASLVVDVRRKNADVDLTVVARVFGESDLPRDGIVLVGKPAHGLFAEEPDRLLLAAFERPLEAATQHLLDQRSVRIPGRDLPRFLTGYYPALRQRLSVECGDGSIEFPEILPPRLVLAVRFEPGHQAQLRWAFGYPTGDELLRVPPDSGAQDIARDAAAEQALVQAAATLPGLPGLSVDETGCARLSDVSLTGMATVSFVEHVLPLLADSDGVVLEISGVPSVYVEAADAPLIKVSTQDSADPQADWFDLLVDVTVAGEQVPLAALIAALAQQQDELILDTGTWFRLDRPELHALRQIIEEARALQDRESDGLRVTAFQAGLWEELVSLGVVERQSERWARTVGGLLALDELPRPDPPDSLDASLRPYQLDGYHWLSLLWDHGLGGILADDMGLGKTLQTLAMAARAQEQGTLGGAAGPLLVVAPTSVVATWTSEADRFCPKLAVRAVTETERRSCVPLADLTAGADLVVTSYALFRIDEAAYRGLTWSGLVLDEAQFVKNHQAKTYQCARRLPAPFKLAITGTPLENSLMDLWSMLSITAPGLFPSPQRFTDIYRKPIESGRSPEQLATLRRRIRPLMLRRTKDQVAPELPPKIEQILEVTLNPQHRRIYDKHLQRERQRVLGLLDDMQRNRIAILRSLTLLRQLSLDASLVDGEYVGAARSSKIDVLMEQLHEVVAEGHRVLVFSQFTGFLAHVRARLDAEGIGHCYLDGRTRNRPARIAEFTEGDAPVFLISLKAGGVGLTLTEADYVFVLDPWWNPATEAQAIDRTHRIGQTRTVMVYRLVARDTIEEKVVALQERKRDLFARVVDDDAMTGSVLTADDIRGLFA